MDEDQLSPDDRLEIEEEANELFELIEFLGPFIWSLKSMFPARNISRSVCFCAGKFTEAHCRDQNVIVQTLVDYIHAGRAAAISDMKLATEENGWMEPPQL